VRDLNGGLAEVGGYDDRMHADLGGGTFSDLSAEVERDDPVADTKHEGHVVFDQQDRET
jgi:hypothetical protein